MKFLNTVVVFLALVQFSAFAAAPQFFSSTDPRAVPLLDAHLNRRVVVDLQWFGGRHQQFKGILSRVWRPMYSKATHLEIIHGELPHVFANWEVLVLSAGDRSDDFEGPVAPTVRLLDLQALTAQKRVGSFTFRSTHAGNQVIRQAVGSLVATSTTNNQTFLEIRHLNSSLMCLRALDDLIEDTIF